MKTFSSHDNPFLDYVRDVVTTYPGFILGAIAEEQLRSLHEAEYFGSREAGYDFDSEPGHISHARMVLSRIVSISERVPSDPNTELQEMTYISNTVTEVELDAAYAVLRGMAPREWVRRAVQAAYDTRNSPLEDE